MHRMKSKLKSAFLVGSALFALSSCVTRGENFSSNTKWLDEAKPDQKQVTELLGTPYKVGTSNGVSTWTYGFYKHQLFGESQIKELKIYWTPDHKVKSYSFSSSFPDDAAPKY